MFVGYQTTREQAHLIGEKASRGCSYADSWSSSRSSACPTSGSCRREGASARDDIIAATEDGILVKGDGSFASISSATTSSSAARRSGR